MDEDYYSKKKTGGVNCSKIEHQDSVAIIYCLELLEECSKVFNINCAIKDYSLKLENDNDLEIISNEIHVFIQVKSSSVDKSNFLEILDDFKNNYEIDKSREKYFILSAFENIKITGGNFSEAHNHYKKVLNNIYETTERKEQVKFDLMNKFGIPKDFDKIIDLLKIDTRALIKDQEDTRAIFARYLQKAYGIKDYGEKQIDSLYEKMCYEFARIRLNRGNILKSEIEDLIGKHLCKTSYYNGIAITLGYEKVEYGYIESKQLKMKYRELVYGGKKAYKSIMREWRKVLF